MYKRVGGFFWVYCLLLVFLTAHPVWAYTLDGGKISLDFEEKVRVESWGTFDDGSKGKDADYTFTSSKMRLGAGFSSRLIDGYAQLHWAQLFGLPDDAMFGTGQLYFSNNHPVGARSDAQNIGYAAISQAWLRVRCPWDEAMSARLGRIDYDSGLEPNTLPKDATLKWLRQNRISQRLIGTFEWTAVGRSFDGLQLAYDQPGWNVTLTGMKPTPGGFYLKRDDVKENGYSAHDVDIVAAVATLKDSMIHGLDSQAFYIYYNDNRGLIQDPEIHNLGAHLLYTQDAGPGKMDLLFWGVYQFGDYARERHSAYAASFEGGYKFKAPWEPWLRAGYFYGSGDDNPKDNDHNTFFMMIPTVRVYAMTPFYTLMNTTDVFAQVILKPYSKVLVRSDLHRLWLTEKKDAWYLGSGITRPDTFGYVTKTGHISKGDDDLGTLWDITCTINDIYSYQGLSLGLNFYYGHVWGGDVVRDNFPKDEDMNFFYVEASIKF